MADSSSRRPLRVAFVGKGGAGKSMIAGTFARLAARSGERVLVLDSDPLPGLALSLGMAAIDAGLPEDSVVEQPEGAPGGRFRLREDARTTAQRHARGGPDGVHLLQMGKVPGREGANPGRSQQAFRLVATALADDPSWHLVGDLPGGTRQPFFGWARWARLVLVVVEPAAASALTARRLARLGERPDGPAVAVVASKVEHGGDPALIAARTGLPVVGAVPLDPAVAEAERRGLAPVEHAPGCPAVEAVRSLLAHVRSRGDGR